MSNSPRKAIDISRLLIRSGERVFVPPPAHDADTIAARVANPPHTTVIEQQYLGAEIALHFYKALAKPTMPKPDVEASIPLITGAAFGAARFLLREGGQQPDTRRFKLPYLIDSKTGLPFTSDERHEKTIAALGNLVDGCEVAYYRKKNSGRVPIKLAHTVGREAAFAAAWSALLPHDAALDTAGSEMEIQQTVVDITMDAIEASLKLGARFYSHLSLAQLSQKETGLTNYLNASPQYIASYNALIEAQQIARSHVPTA